MSRQTFLKGAFILIIAGFITKVLGFINRIVMARIMGAEGVGLYMMAVPTLLLVITLTQLGLPVAISKLVAEAEAAGDRGRMKRILVVSLSLTSILSVVFTVIMIGFAPLISEKLLTDARAFYPLVAITPIVPIVALSSVMRGYFQGRQNMKPSAFSQVIEQVVRITLVAVMANAFLPMGIEYAAAGAMVSVVIGELASLGYMIFVFKTQKKVPSAARLLSISERRNAYVQKLDEHCPANDRKPFNRFHFAFFSNRLLSLKVWRLPASQPYSPRNSTASWQALSFLCFYCRLLLRVRCRSHSSQPLARPPHKSNSI